MAQKEPGAAKEDTACAHSAVISDARGSSVYSSANSFPSSHQIESMRASHLVSMHHLKTLSVISVPQHTLQMPRRHMNGTKERILLAPRMPIVPVPRQNSTVLPEMCLATVARRLTWSLGDFGCESICPNWKAIVAAIWQFGR